jgi:hypothetical protein
MAFGEGRAERSIADSSISAFPSGSDEWPAACAGGASGSCLTVRRISDDDAAIAVSGAKLWRQRR